MKIVVIGGTGRIGSKVVGNLTARGHEAVPASPNTGVDATTGRGLAEALAGTDVVVDVSNSPTFDEAVAKAFFESAGRHLAAAERNAGVRHHLALSVVGTERLQVSGYFRAKLLQEELITSSGIPWTIVRATQFFEFLGAIAAESAAGDRVRLSPAAFQPMAADDVAQAVADAALAPPRNDIIEIAGPELRPMNEIVERYLRATNDEREVVPDAHALYFGIPLDDHSLVPGRGARLGAIRLDDWLRRPEARS